ncbi:hypothetical protein E4V01_03500 [Methylorubrum sp. Q1]|nr:hypothetical protein E4V01_03500 [Methylorubrum sp. Q1]
MLDQGVTQLVPEDRGPRLVGRQDQVGLRLDPVRDVIAPRRPGRERRSTDTGEGIGILLHPSTSQSPTRPNTLGRSSKAKSLSQLARDRSISEGGCSCNASLSLKISMTCAFVALLPPKC